MLEKVSVLPLPEPKSKMESKCNVSGTSNSLNSALFATRWTELNALVLCFTWNCLQPIRRMRPSFAWSSPFFLPTQRKTCPKCMCSRHPSGNASNHLVRLSAPSSCYLIWKMESWIHINGPMLGASTTQVGRVMTNPKFFVLSLHFF